LIFNVLSLFTTLRTNFTLFKAVRWKSASVGLNLLLSPLPRRQILSRLTSDLTLGNKNTAMPFFAMNAFADKAERAGASSW